MNDTRTNALHGGEFSRSTAIGDGNRGGTAKYPSEYQSSLPTRRLSVKNIEVQLVVPKLTGEHFDLPGMSHGFKAVHFHEHPNICITSQKPTLHKTHGSITVRHIYPKQQSTLSYSGAPSVVRTNRFLAQATSAHLYTQ